MIRAHALLHQATRERDAKGRIVSTIDDYALVRDMLADVISEAVEKTVKPEVREVVGTVAQLADDGEVTQKQIADETGLDKGSVSRRVRAALDGGYLLNKEEKRGRPHRLVVGDPLPDDLEILPTVEELHGCTVARGDDTPPPTQGGNGRVAACLQAIKSGHDADALGFTAEEIRLARLCIDGQER